MTILLRVMKKMSQFFWRISQDNQKNLSDKMMSTINRYSEISGREFTDKVRAFIDAEGVDFQEVKKYISMFPNRVYHNIYEAGLKGEMN